MYYSGPPGVLGMCIFMNHESCVEECGETRIFPKRRGGLGALQKLASRLEFSHYEQCYIVNDELTTSKLVWDADPFLQASGKDPHGLMYQMYAGLATLFSHLHTKWLAGELGGFLGVRKGVMGTGTPQTGTSSPEGPDVWSNSLHEALSDFLTAQVLPPLLRSCCLWIDSEESGEFAFPPQTIERHVKWLYSQGKIHSLFAVNSLPHQVSLLEPPTEQEEILARSGQYSALEKEPMQFGMHFSDEWFAGEGGFLAEGWGIEKFALLPKRQDVQHDGQQESSTRRTEEPPPTMEEGLPPPSQEAVVDGFRSHPAFPTAPNRATNLRLAVLGTNQWRSLFYADFWRAVAQDDVPDPVFLRWFVQHRLRIVPADPETSGGPGSSKNSSSSGADGRGADAQQEELPRHVHPPTVDVHPDDIAILFFYLLRFYSSRHGERLTAPFVKEALRSDPDDFATEWLEGAHVRVISTTGGTTSGSIVSTMDDAVNRAWRRPGSSSPSHDEGEFRSGSSSSEKAGVHSSQTQQKDLREDPLFLNNDENPPFFFRVSLSLTQKRPFALLRAILRRYDQRNSTTPLLAEFPYSWASRLPIFHVLDSISLSTLVATPKLFRAVAPTYETVDPVDRENFFVANWKNLTQPEQTHPFYTELGSGPWETNSRRRLEVALMVLPQRRDLIRNSIVDGTLPAEAPRGGRHPPSRLRRAEQI